MNLLKKIPVQYKGELHDVKLVNFTVDINEVQPFVPEGIKVRDFNGKAIISMVNVHLKDMRPDFLPAALSFDYHHLAFRLLIDDGHRNNGESKGIFFLRSFTDVPFIVWGGGLMTDYNLELAKIKEYGGTTDLYQQDKYISYTLGNVTRQNPDLHKTICVLDRAYSVQNDQVMMTRIMRECWPIEQVECTDFKTNYFKSAELLGAFKVNEVIPYTWLPATAIEQLLPPAPVLY